MARTEYMHGNTVRKEYQPVRERRPVPAQETSTGKKRRRHMSLGYLVFLTLAMVLMVGALAWYISLQAQVKNTSKNIATLESQLNTLKQENDEAYSRANGKVDLEEVKRIAISEYGMTYATEGQIVNYSDGGGNDYVRQVAPIPQGDN